MFGKLKSYKNRYGAMAALLAMMTLGFLLPDVKKMKKNDEGNFGQIGQNALVVVGIVIGAVVLIILIATLFPTYSGAVKNLTSNVTNADFGNGTTNALLPVFALVISLGGLFAIVGLIFLAYHFKHK